MKLIMLGAPGAGKGTQAAVICEAYSIPAISTGNMIRDAIKDDTPLGQKAREFVQSGALVPDDIVIGMLIERIAMDDCKKGFVLDGFPRTLPQAKALDDMGVNIDKVVALEVTDSCIEERLTGRRVCAGCGASYHLQYNPPGTAELCDKCARPLTVRDDDRPETVRQRLRVYHEQTQPLIDYYKAAGKLRVVEGKELIADTARLTLAAIEA